jgi:hypothetical protein
VEVLTEGPTRVGTRAVDTRRVPGGRRRITYEITEHDPPRKAAFRGLDGPIRAEGSQRVEPAGEGTRVSFEMEMRGHGIGVLMLPLARRQASRQVAESHEKLKRILEGGAGG